MHQKRKLRKQCIQKDPLQNNIPEEDSEGSQQTSHYVCCLCG